MSREIKFRVWNGKKFVQSPKYIKTTTGEVFSYEADYGGMFSSHESLEKYSGTIQQYTGLKDKNGIEIFEGDILEYSVGSIYREFVKWESGCFYLVTANEDSATPLAGARVVCRVVGNIHENLELIKNK